MIPCLFVFSGGQCCLPSSQRQSSQRKTRILGSCEDFTAHLNGKPLFIAQNDKELKWGGLSRRSELRSGSSAMPSDCIRSFRRPGCAADGRDLPSASANPTLAPSYVRFSCLANSATYSPWNRNGEKSRKLTDESPAVQVRLIPWRLMTAVQGKRGRPRAKIKAGFAGLSKFLRRWRCRWTARPTAKCTRLWRAHSTERQPKRPSFPSASDTRRAWPHQVRRLFSTLAEHCAQEATNDQSH
jgi:hypothetical protein